MSALPAVFSLLGTSYTALGTFISLKASRPSCRVCVNRHVCPDRLRGRDEFTQLPTCLQAAHSPMLLVDRRAPILN
jgi:hypothetical protein